MGSTSGTTTKPVAFKFQGVPSKSKFYDEYVHIRDTDLGHTDLANFLKACNKLVGRSDPVSALIHSILVNTASHPTSVQSAKLIMTLAQHFVLEERVVKRTTGEVVLDLRPDNIQRVFHLPRADQFIRLIYEEAERWYREHQK